jgi:DNA recombination protein RmuC
MTDFEICAAVSLIVLCVLQGITLLSFARRERTVSPLEVSQVEERLKSEIGTRTWETISVVGEVRESVDRKLAEIGTQHRRNWESLEWNLKQQDHARRGQIDDVRKLLEEKLTVFVTDLERNRKSIEDGLKEILGNASDYNIRALEQQREQADRINTTLQAQTDKMSISVAALQTAIQTKLADIQGGNERKLEEMRQTVDEKLKSTLEQRISQSFEQVVINLESVQRGLGEMRSLAKGVGDLNRVFSNVKTRGVFGEVQLRAILEEMLRPDQFVRNFKPRDDSSEVVEFAIKIPNSKRTDGSSTYIPVDAKFPKEDYERLQLAHEAGNASGIESARKKLLTAIEGCAHDIGEKYVAPPHTTNFGIMFLATEGLYAEALREPGFQERLQREYRVIIAGPTTLSAILCSLSVGFQTIDIERRSHEIQMVLSAVKTEFGKFGAVIERVKKQINTASRTLDQTSVRTRKMDRALDGISAMPAEQTTRIFEYLNIDLTALGADEPESVEGEEFVEEVEEAQEGY